MSREGAAGLEYGPWTVVGELGRGGMAEVLLVQRKNPEQRAALKILPLGMHGEQERRRFRREQEILARLAHPNIARFLDAGETANGELYLVLEQVEGLPIDLHCAFLPLRARIEIFLDLCRAVAAAHQQLVVHCDLKPSNVLVRPDGTVKLLDFGLARLADQTLATATVLSGFSTWAYASPEQLTGQPLSAASDVYSLGVLLYRILAGRPLFGEHGKSLLAQIEARKDPPRASSALPPDAPRAFVRALRQDLDAVIARAIRLDPAARYSSVDELIADLEAHLEGLPVAARRGDRRYEIWRFARRHALPLLAGTVLTMFAVGATATLAAQARQLAAERDLARQQEQVARRSAEYFLGLIEGNPADPGQPGELTVQELGHRALLGLSHSLLDAPLVRAQVLLMLANHFRQVANLGEAENMLREALQIWETALDPGDPRVLKALHSLALCRFVSGNLDGSETLGKLILERAEKRRDGSGKALALDILGLTALQRNEIAEGERLMTEAEALSARHHGINSWEHERQLMGLIIAKQSAKRHGDREALLRQLLHERQARRPGASDYNTQTRATELAALLVARGALDEAETVLQSVIAMRGRSPMRRFMLVREQHPAEVDLQLSDIKRRRGDFAGALRLAETAIASLERDLPPDSYRHLEAQRVLASALLGAGRPAEAAAILEQVLTDSRDLGTYLAPDFPVLEAELRRARELASRPPPR